jgi:hypothetical protein
MDKQKTRKRLDRCRAISDACADGVNMAIKLTFISVIIGLGASCFADYFNNKLRKEARKKNNF